MRDTQKEERSRGKAKLGIAFHLWRYLLMSKRIKFDLELPIFLLVSNKLLMLNMEYLVISLSRLKRYQQC